MTKRRSPASSSERDPGSFGGLVEGSELFSPPEAASDSQVELVGRVVRLEEEDKFLLLVPSGETWGELAVEIKLEQVLHSELLFEDSAGRQTCRVRIPAGTVVKLVFRATELATRLQAKAPARKQEPIPAWRYDLARQPQAPAARDDPAARGGYAPAPSPPSYAPGQPVRYAPAPYPGYAPAPVPEPQLLYYPAQYTQPAPGQLWQYVPGGQPGCAPGGQAGYTPAPYAPYPAGQYGLYYPYPYVR
jgi:hypothetical protein